MFSKILIANRGEVAVRVIRACKEMDIRTVSVYSEPDADCLHAKLADEAVCIGSSLPSESYLNIPAIISAAEITDVDAIHPGYGFLAENAHFAEICESCDIAFIGPTPENMRLLGDKVAARQTMQKVGIPVIPGSENVIKTKEDAIKIAKKLKYPVIIKASAGGGGKGMRVCHNDIRLISSLMTAQQEAETAFGDSRVYLEKYLERPRHIEVQILADKQGHVIHLGERDCTIQRRHQKLVEESPSPALTSKLRKKIGDMAVKVGKSCGYLNAGTVEFLMDRYENFYFLEVNTRIQVEHPVTEMVTGIDLVKEQIKIANGTKIPYKQDDIKIKGAAIECRINAEDSENDFMPNPGRINVFLPPGGPGVRVDSHLYSGYTVPPYYDSMLAKIICWGKNRPEAIKIMRRALDEMVTDPVKTTVPFHKHVMSDSLFLRAEVATDYVDKMLNTE